MRNNGRTESIAASFVEIIYMDKTTARTRDDGAILEFRRLQTRQILASAIALFLVLGAAVVHKRPDIFGAFTSTNLFTAQAIVIVGFIAYSAVNWRCPSCKKYLGADIYKTVCRKCRTRLQ